MGVCVLSAFGPRTPCNNPAKGVIGDPVAAGIIAEPVYVFLKVVQGSGAPIFAAMALIFAIGVAIGLSRNDGVAALAATVGYLVMNGLRRDRRRRHRAPARRRQRRQYAAEMRGQLAAVPVSA